MSRPLYRFARFDLKTVAGADRGRALELQIRHWSPFINAAWYLLWEGQDALVWVWDADKVEAAMAAEGVKAGSIAIVPETLLHPRRSEGVHLSSCVEGFEGQVWHAGSLASSRWWASLPRPAEWLTFQRDAGAAVQESSSIVPEAAPLEWCDRPWGESQAREISPTSITQRERWIVPAIAFCLFASTLWYGAQVLKIRYATDQRAAQLQELDRRAEPILVARGQALEALARLEALQGALDRFPDQVTLLSRVAESLPKDGTYLKQWEFTNGKLRVQVAATKEAPSSEWIKRFESLGVFRNVQAMPGSDAATLQLSMDAVPVAEASASGVRLTARQ